MILTVAAVLTGFGFIAWAFGIVFEYPGVAMIGATVVAGVGAMLLMGTGLETKTGTVETTNADNETVVKNAYEPINTPTNFSLGSITLLLGGTLALRALDGAGGG